MTNPWSDISSGDGKRVNSDGKYDFFWMKFGDEELGLVLKLPAGVKKNLPLPRLRNIDVTYSIMDSNVFALKLCDLTQQEVFLTLCLDVVAIAETADSIDTALARAIRRTRRWHYLLKGGGNGGLSIEEQRGLVGELAFLRQLVSAISPAAAIEAWKGPERSAKDFEFPGVCVEIKARRGAAKPHISISSAEQLTNIDLGRLFLRVFDVDSAIKPKGANLHDHVEKTAILFEDDDQAFAAWENLMEATGYDKKDDYESRRWVLGTERNYDVVDGFPRIITPLPSGVEKVSYTVSLQACEPFCFEENVMDVIIGEINGE